MPTDSSRLSLEGRQRDIVAAFGALCMFLSTVEYLIPKPMPFFRLGLASLPLLLALTFLKPGHLFLVLLLKVLGQGLVNGTLASYVFLFSLAGSTVSLLVMWTVHRLGKKSVSLFGVSLAGAMGSSVVQISLAVTFIFGAGARLIAPLFLGSGAAAGGVIGIFAVLFLEKSAWLSGVKALYRGEISSLGVDFAGADDEKSGGESETASSHRRRRRKDVVGLVLNPVPRSVLGMLLLPPFLLVENLVFKGVLLMCFAMFAVLAGKRIRWGYFLILTFSVVFFHLLTPHGRVLLEAGPLTVTGGALESGLRRGLSLVGMVFLSVAAVHPELELPGRLGGLLEKTFFFFESLLNGKSRLTRHHFFETLDSLLKDKLRLDSAPNPVETDHERRAGRAGLVFGGILAAAVWAVLALDLFSPWI